MNNVPVLTYGTKLYDGKKNLIVVLFFSDSCNYNCIYCGNKFPRTNFKLNPQHVLKSLKLLLNTIDGDIFIEILGGEPTTHQGFYDFCKELSNEKRFKPSVYTNFSASTQMYVDLLQSGINIIPSWHSIPMDKHNQSFVDKVLDVSSQINKKLNIRIMYEPFASSESIDVFNQLIMHRDKINIEFSLLVNSPLFTVNYTSQQLVEYKKCQDLVYHENDDIFMQFSDGTSKLVGYYDIFKNSNLSFRFWQCNAGFDTIYIHSDGNAYTCPKFFTDNKKPLYNIYETGIKMISHPTICSFARADCECDKEVKKRKILK